MHSMAAEAEMAALPAAIECIREEIRYAKRTSAWVDDGS